MSYKKDDPVKFNKGDIVELKKGIFQWDRGASQNSPLPEKTYFKIIGVTTSGNLALAGMYAETDAIFNGNAFKLVKNISKLDSFIFKLTE